MPKPRPAPAPGDPPLRARGRVAGVLLAAGASQRFGAEGPKQLLELGGEPLVRRAARVALAASLDPVLVVLGHRRERIRPALSGLAVEVVENPRHREGQSTSLRAGLAALAGGEGEPAAAVFLPADQPFLSPRLIDSLLAAFARGAAIAVPVHGGRRGAPVLFGRALFAELSRLEGDTGGRALLGPHAEKVVEVPAADPLELFDIDRPEDYRKALAEAGRRSPAQS